MQDWHKPIWKQKTDFDTKLSRINRKIAENRTENLSVKNELNKFKTYWKLFKTTSNFIHSWKSINIYIIYELGASGSQNNDPTLKNSLFGAVTLTKNTDIDMYVYSG